MNPFDYLQGKQVLLELSGQIKLSGILIDYGLDVIVLFNSRDFLYIPIQQIQNMKLNPNPDVNLIAPSQLPIENQTDRISLRKMLTNAKGMFLKMYVIGNQTIHGYVINILNDYFVFYSPVYKTMYISLHHLKWLMPYTQNVTPYSLNNQQLPFTPTNATLPRTFDEQLRRLEGKIVVFDIGDHPSKTGMLKQVANSMATIVLGEGEEISWNLQHLKTAHVP